MLGSIKPLKGKDRFQLAPDWLKDFYSLLRSLGTDIEPEGGLFRLTASYYSFLIGFFLNSSDAF